MAGLPSPGAVVKIALSFERDAGLPYGCRFYFAYSGATPTSTILSTFAGDVAFSWNTRLGASISETCTLKTVTVTDLSSSSGAEGTWTGSDSGTLTDVALPNSACFVVNFELNERYRGGKPKIFLPLGDADSIVDSTQWTSAFAGAALAGWQTFITDLLGASTGGVDFYQHISVSWYSGFTPVQNPVTGRYRNVPKKRAEPVTYQVTGYAYRTIIGSQRRRNSLKS